MVQVDLGVVVADNDEIATKIFWLFVVIYSWYDIYSAKYVNTHLEGSCNICFQIETKLNWIDYYYATSDVRFN